MDPSKKINYPPTIRADKSDGLTVMVIGSVGRVKSFKVSRRGILGVVIFLLLYIPASIYLINEFFELRHDYKVQGINLDKRDEELSSVNQELLKSEQHVALLNNYIQEIKKPVSHNNENVGTYVENRIDQYVETKEEDIVSEDPETENKTIEYGNSVIVEDFSKQIEGPSMTVDFKLSNTQPDKNTVEGYVHIIVESEIDGSTRLWSYRNATIKDGLPSDFRRGKLFSIKRFRQITVEIDLGSDQVILNKIRVLVYNKSGTLIYVYEKEYEVSNET
jgi:hypothetical protein